MLCSDSALVQGSREEEGRIKFLVMGNMQSILFILPLVVIYYVYTLLFARVATWHYFFSILMLSGISKNNKKK